MLDWGAAGVVFPLIRAVDDARRASQVLGVAACRYPPQGGRGFFPRDVSGFFKDVEHYLATANERMIAMLQVEHVDAVNNLDGILAGLFWPDPAAAYKAYRDRGLSFMPLGADYDFIKTAAAELLNELRRQ